MKTNQVLWEEITSYQPKDGGTAFWWLGQMGYVIKLGEQILCLDPFISRHPERRIPPLLEPEEIANADYIFGSHDHLDHIDRDAWVKIAKVSTKTKFVVPKKHVTMLSDDLEIHKERFVGIEDGESICLSNDLKVYGVASAHEFLDRDEEGAYPYMGFVLEGAGLRIYHPGDTCIYEGYFQKLRDLGAIDIMFLPINGRDGKRYQSNIIGNMTYQEAVDLAGAMHPGLVVPGHYEMFEGNRENPALFEDYLKAKYKGVPYWIGEHGSLCVYQTKKQGVEGR